MVGIDKSGLGSYDFSTQLLDTAAVAVAPGLTFGPNSDQTIRISFCADKAEVEAGIQRLCQFYKQFSGT